MDSLVQLSKFPSPALTDPDTLLPRGNAPSATSPARVIRPPSPSYLLDAAEDKDVPRSIAPKKSLGSMSTRRGLHRSETEGDKALIIMTNLNTGDNAVKREEIQPSRWLRGDQQRTTSFLSTSTATLDWDAIPEYKYDGEESVVTLEDGASLTTSPMRSTAGTHYPIDVRNPAATQLDSKDEADNASIELSRRAELILANAKKRLKLMDQNLKGARALTAENLHRATSVRVQKVAHTNRLLRDDNGDEPRIKSGHVRVRSDNTIIHPLVESPTGIAAEIVDEEPDEWAPAPAPAPLRASKSQDLPQIRSLNGHQSRSHKHTASLRTFSGPNTPNSSRGYNEVRSSPATTDLKNQVQELNRRISLLRDKTREDSLRRQSFQSLRNPSPFTDAETHTKLVSRSPELAPPEPPLLSRWSTDSSVTRLSSFLPLDNSPSTIHSEKIELPTPRHTKQRARITDWRPIEPGKDRRPSRVTEGSETDDEAAGNVEEMLDFGIGSSAASRPPPAHEDRLDAFDYDNCFLHSTLGGSDSIRHRRISEASDETARGPTRRFLPSSTDTPERLRAIERSIHKRFTSVDTLSSSTSFATAEENGLSRQASPVKCAPQPSPTKRTIGGSDGADSGVGLQDRSRPKPRTHERQLSIQLSEQVQAIAAPPSAVAIAALAAPGKRPLGSSDRAQVLMLLECIRHACDKLQDQDLSQSEGRILRRRIEEAKKVMDGTAPVVS